MGDLHTARAEAEALYSAGKAEEALARYRALLDEHPDDAGLLNDVGTVCFAMGRVPESVDWYLKALQVDPDDAAARKNLATVAQTQGLSLPELQARARQGNPEAAVPRKQQAAPATAPEGPGLRYIYPLGRQPGREHTRRARIFTDPRCNVRCRFCYYVNRHAEAWPARLIERQIDFAARAGMRDVDFSGGESSMRRDFVDLVAYAAQYGFRSVCTLTNGWKFADEEFMARAVEAGLTEILFSVHGYDEENHDWLTQVKGSYRRILRAIELAHEHGLTVRTNTTVTRANFERLDEHARFIRDTVRPCQANLILFNEFSEAGSIADQFSVRYSEAAGPVRAAVDVLKDSVPYVNVRYVPFCFMQGYEEHVCDYAQKIYDPFEWSQRMLALCQKAFIEAPMRYYGYLADTLDRFSQSLDLDPACISDHLADDVFVTRNRYGYVMAESCRECRYFHVCDGVEREYSAQVGLGELKPVAGERMTDPLAFREHFYDGYERHLPARPAGGRGAPTRAVRATGRAGTVSVLIPTYQRSAVLAECLRCLAQQEMDAGRFEVLVVDDGSTDSTPEVAAQYAADLDLKYIRGEHAGAAAARNLGIREASGDLVVIINDDTLVEPDFLEQHYRLHEVFGWNDKTVVLGNRRFPPALRHLVMNYLFENVPLYNALHEMPRGWYNYRRFITFNLSAVRAGFLKYGVFDTGFPSALVEDIELGLRWQLSGAKVFSEPRIMGYHNHRMTVAGWDSHIVRLNQNRRVMYAKHPEVKPARFFMDADEGQMRAFVERSAPHMERFRGELERIEGENVLEIVGRTFMGKRVESVECFLGIVREMVPHYKPYRAYRQHLDTCCAARGVPA